ncbi:hypothetical protein GGI43DRAFT_432639 [Trichoderma evansii]
MTETRPQGLFAPKLESDRLTYALFDMKNEMHMQFSVDIFNIEAAGIGPTDGAWTTNDARRLWFSWIMKPSDAQGRLLDTPCAYLVHLKNAPATPIGIITLCRRTPDIPLDLGYLISADYQSKGYGSEGSGRISRYWKDEFGLEEICIITGENNIPARKIAEGIDFIEGGYVMMGNTKMVAYVLPGMKKLDGQNFPFWGDGNVLEEN